MKEKNNYGFGVRKIVLPKRMWSFGVSLSHYQGETYLFFNFVKWSFIIGWLEKEK